MSENFLDQVNDIVMSNIDDENFGVRDLSSSLDLSASQTLRKVKSVTGISVNQYIRKVRLKVAAKLIKETDFTAAEISYKVGFGSPSYFNKTFRKQYGITPGEYKAQNKSLSDLEKRIDEFKNKNFFFKNRVLISISGFLLLAAAYLLISNLPSSEIKERTNSIAVLPFKTLGKTDSLSFAEGMTYLLLDNLSKVKNLTVKSKNSSEIFRDSIITSSKIGEILGANFIVEGSVQQNKDSIRVIVTLIDTENDQQIWSKTYKRDLKDIWTLQMELSKLIVLQLDITISPQDEKKLENSITNNMEAYNFYIKGKAMADERSYSFLKNSIESFKQAIMLDSEFGHAYAEIASSYSQLNVHAGRNDSIRKDNLINIEKYLTLAEDINPNIARIYSVRGMLHLEEMQYQKAEVTLKRALEINPNDEIVQLHIGVFYLFKNIPEVDKYLYHVNKALEIDPVSTHLKRSRVWALIENGKVDEAEKAMEEYKSAFSEGDIYNHNSQIIAYKNKDWNAAYTYLKDAFNEDPENKVIVYNIVPICYSLNKNEEYLYFTKLAYKFARKGPIATYNYSNSLLKNNKIEELEAFLNREDVKNVLDKNTSLKDFIYFDYYFYLGDYEKVLTLINNVKYVRNKSNSLFNPLYKSLVYAKQGEIDSIYKIMKTYPYSSLERARIFAVMQERDSMYHYLNGKSNLREIMQFNGYMDFDPYRNEPKFKAFLKKYYLPK